jgi:hypothetical protein
MKANDDAGRREPLWSERDRPADLHEETLQVVRSRQGPLALSELASIVADRQQAAVTSPGEEAGDREHVQLRLHHVALPKLQDRGSIEYDPVRRQIL